MTPKRILHSIQSVNPAGGGPIEAVRQLAVAGAELGQVTEVVSLDSPDAPWVVQCPLTVHALGPGMGKYGYGSAFTSWLRANACNYDAVIINGLWQYNGFGAWRALRKSGTPYFVYPHGMLDPWFKRTYPLKHLKKWFYWPWAEYRVLRDAAAVLFTCEQERRLARESFWLYRCQEHVVNFGTAAPVGDTGAQRELFWKRHPGLRGKRCLLFLGRVHVKKGPDMLLEAFQRVLGSLSAEVGNPLHLVMAGPYGDAYGRTMIALAKALGIEERVTWTGMLGGDLKWGAFRAADAFVLPSHQENFGIAVTESLACGIPVLISDQVNICVEVAEYQAGFVESDTVEGTVRLLRNWLATEPAQWEVMRQNARRCFSEKFHITRAAQSLAMTMQNYTRRARADRK